MKLVVSVKESCYICIKLEKSNNTDSTKGVPLRISQDEPFTASIKMSHLFKKYANQLLIDSTNFTDHYFRLWDALRNKSKKDLGIN